MEVDLNNLNFIISNNDELQKLSFAQVRAHIQNMDIVGATGAQGNQGISGNTGAIGGTTGPTGDIKYKALVVDTNASVYPVVNENNVIVATTVTSAFTNGVRNAIIASTPGSNVFTKNCSFISSTTNPTIRQYGYYCSSIGSKLTRLPGPQYSTPGPECRFSSTFGSFFGTLKNSNYSSVLGCSSSGIYTSSYSCLVGSYFGGLKGDFNFGICSRSSNTSGSRITNVSGYFSNTSSGTENVSITSNGGVLAGSNNALIATDVYSSVSGQNNAVLTSNYASKAYGNRSVIISTPQLAVNPLYASYNNCAAFVSRLSVPSNNTLITRRIDCSNRMCTSDINLKKDIIPYTNENDRDTFLEKVKNFQTKKYRLKEDLDPNAFYRYGFIAQDLEVDFPELVVDSWRREIELKWLGNGPTGATGHEYWEIGPGQKISSGTGPTGFTLEESDVIVINPEDPTQASIYRDQSYPTKYLAVNEMEHFLFYTAQQTIELLDENKMRIDLMLSQADAMQSQIDDFVA